MLEILKLRNIGPAPKLELAFHPRVNLVTGDNGLGKTFLLDTAWWSLTGTLATRRESAVDGRTSRRAARHGSTCYDQDEGSLVGADFRSYGQVVALGGAVDA